MARVRELRGAEPGFTAKGNHWNQALGRVNTECEKHPRISDLVETRGSRNEVTFW